jgi:hypothetical protein
MNTNQIVKIYDEDGIGYDVCEVEPAPSTRVVRVISSHRVPSPEDRTYSIQHAHACGYRD